MQDSGSRRRLTLLTGQAEDSDAQGSGEVEGQGLADVEILQRRAAAQSDAVDEQGFYLETVSEYLWARDVAGLAPSTLENLVRPVLELCSFYDLVPWQLTPRHVDRFYTGPGRRARSTVRSKLTKLDSYFAFLEQRYAGEIARRFGARVESPVDTFNRPVHRGDFGLRIPPSQRALAECFSKWRASLPAARKYQVAVRDYVMAKIAYVSGVRASELCAVRLGDIHWELGQWGRFVVQGKGAGGSGKRERQAYLFAEGRELLWWYIEEVRGLFSDDASDPAAPLFPSERRPRAVAALNITVAMPVRPDAFRKALKTAGGLYLPGPVTCLFPHLLRHARATHLYESGMALWDVQKVLGHIWASTTVGYLSTVQADPELASLQSARRAVRRLSMEA
ncbi:site-specific integrase [Streptomyces sp. V1I1]|uniref:tyrosine-type recombinase/integrase n=1 Tax=Streptomyces sp. V1I1 TaxID=3042272 RepID=UPI0027871241|nr:site-specific integrase [Streptomyces sp. V1I1]MDQ0941801.1 integrase [Streptomyces sp. V1I1]